MAKTNNERDMEGSIREVGVFLGLPHGSDANSETIILAVMDSAEKAKTLVERTAQLEIENKRLRTVMVAAAEEIHTHWSAHCDVEGYGPSNLIRRLEDGIPAQYGYTAGAFSDLRTKVKHLEALLQRDTAKSRFDANGATDELSPLGRLRYYCSLAMTGQDWLDVEPFFSDLEAELSKAARKCGVGRAGCDHIAPCGSVCKKCHQVHQGAQQPSSTLSMEDAFTLLGHAVHLHNEGQTDMPAFFADLAGRIADASSIEEGARVRGAFVQAVDKAQNAQSPLPGGDHGA